MNDLHPDFGAPACQAHLTDEYASPRLACRFAHMCDECAKITTAAVVGEFNKRPVVLHDVPIKFVVDGSALHMACGCWAFLRDSGEVTLSIGSMCAVSLSDHQAHAAAWAMARGVVTKP